MAPAFPQIYDRYAKTIVLPLCKYRGRELTREDLLKGLNLDITDGELQKKIKTLIKTNIINQGTSNFRYRRVKDNIFDKVFRGVYEEEIRKFDVGVIRKEYSQEFAKLKKQYDKKQGGEEIF